MVFYVDLLVYVCVVGMVSVLKALDAFAAATGTFEVRAEDVLKVLRVFSVWLGWLEDLFVWWVNWKLDVLLVILEVWCYEAREGLTIDFDDERYGGCKSWVDIDVWVVDDVFVLCVCVLDEEFEVMLRLLCEDLFVIGVT